MLSIELTCAGKATMCSAAARWRGVLILPLVEEVDESGLRIFESFQSTRTRWDATLVGAPFRDCGRALRCVAPKKIHAACVRSLHWPSLVHLLVVFFSACKDAHAVSFS